MTIESNTVKAIKVLTEFLGHEALTIVRMFVNKRLSAIKLDTDKAETDDKIDATFGENEGYAVIIKSDAHIQLGCTVKVAWYSSSTNLYGIANSEGSAMRGDCIELIGKNLYDFLQEKNDLIEDFIKRSDSEGYNYTPK